MSKSVVRILLTILMYTGVVVFLFPYFTGKVTEGIMFVAVGAIFAVVCGLLRCYLTEGDCTDPVIVPPQALTPSNAPHEMPGARKR